MSTANGLTGASAAHSVGDRHLLALGLIGVMTLTGALTLSTLYRNVQKLDPGGASRAVTLPAEATNGSWFLIENTADAAGELITVQDDTPTTVRVLSPGESALFVCEGAAWYCVPLVRRELVNLGVRSATLAADDVLLATSARFQKLDPGGAHRNVDLPAAAAGLTFTFHNAADAAENLVIRLTGAGATVVTVNQNEGVTVVCDGTNWTHMGVQTLALT